ncbi:MAG: hypothetical protein KDD34_08495 [Bdellovibrionales bacterium]|nr:hypothetical protein [Bdellovibrionales bacterium]
MNLQILFAQVFIGIIYSSLTLAASFDGRTEFTHFDLQGEFSVSCMSGQERGHAIYQCRGYLMEPSSFAYFYHDPNASVERVELSAMNKKGQKILKKSNWNSQENRTEKRINLWVETLFQKPLLELGDNKVQFVFFNKKNQIVESDEFMVRVDNGGLRECHSRSHFTSDMQMCNSGAFACDEYFYLENDCNY